MKRAAGNGVPVPHAVHCFNSGLILNMLPMVSGLRPGADFSGGSLRLLAMVARQ
jgi:hypothetical protein